MSTVKKKKKKKKRKKRNIVKTSKRVFGNFAGKSAKNRGKAARPTRRALISFVILFYIFAFFSFGYRKIFPSLRAIGLATSLDVSICVKEPAYMRECIVVISQESLASKITTPYATWKAYERRERSSTPKGTINSCNFVDCDVFEIKKKKKKIVEYFHGLFYFKEFWNL